MSRLRVVQELLLKETQGKVEASEFASTIAPLRGRIILYHGLNTSVASFRSTSPFDQLINGLQAQGFDVIVPSVTGDGNGSAQSDYLTGRFNADATGGNEKATILSDYDNLIDSIADIHPLYLGAISWGAIHMATIMGNRGGIDGFFMHLPAFPPNVLSEFGGYSLSALGTFDTSAISLIADQGWCSYADDDARVGHAGAEAFIAATGCEPKHYLVLGHATTPDTVVDMLTFTAALP